MKIKPVLSIIVGCVTGQGVIIKPFIVLLRLIVPFLFQGTMEMQLYLPYLLTTSLILKLFQPLVIGQLGVLPQLFHTIIMFMPPVKNGAFRSSTFQTLHNHNKLVMFHFPPGIPDISIVFINMEFERINIFSL